LQHLFEENESALVANEDLSMEDLSLPPLKVIGEHPTYEFSIGDFIAVPASKEPFWLAIITAINESSLDFTYYHHSPPPKASENTKMKWTPHSSTGSRNS
jgi:hypothetical protein